MELAQIYQCFCDQTRLRILHLLAQTPLCVCHFQEILGEPQVKISKHLAYLRKREMVVAERQQNWMMYSLPGKRAPELEANLKCLRDCAQSDPVFKGDLKALAKLQSDLLRAGGSFCDGKTPPQNFLIARKIDRELRATRPAATWRPASSSPSRDAP